MADNERSEDGAGDEGAKAAPRSKRKLVIIAAAVLVLIGAGGGGWFFLGHRGAEPHAEAKAPNPPVFVDVPDILVNLAALPGERAQYLKLKVVLEVKDEPLVEKIKPTMPRLTDIFQTYLRELRVADLSGSAGLFRLKEELTKRVNAVVAPGHVDAVLFKEVVVQ
ncbi:MAG: flagellar basal body-associated protein FliL [Xanthobacteraceae bacterium]|nr:flagellar basal body-associated protein FliL [Xanthobacteraceae bacterium]